MQSREQRVGIVEELRGLAALAVAWFHFTNGNPRFLDDGLLKSSGTYGWLGVEVFFVISGFVIPLSMRRARYRLPAHLSGFVLRRLVRLEPPYLVCIVLTLVLWYLSSWTPGFRGSPPEWSMSQLLLHAGYLIAFTDEKWLNPVFWTLAIEFQYYLALAILFPLISHRSLVVSLSTIACLALLSFAPFSGRMLFVYLSLFAMGMLTYHYHEGRLRRDGYLILCLGAAAVTVATLGWLTAVVGLVCAWSIAFIRRSGNQSLLILGTISYSVYLLHVPIGGRVINLGERFAESAWSQLAVLAVAMSVTLVAAALYHRIIEGPAQAWSRKVPYGEPARARARP